MDKRIAFVAGTTTFVVTSINILFHRRSVNKLVSDNSQKTNKYVRSAWREGFGTGFDDCNRRFNYQIPRSEYPQFD